jgi:hypothetical protein
MSLAPAGLSGKDQAASLGDEVRREARAEQRQAQDGLVGEVELVDGLEEREAGAADEALQAGLLAVGDLLAHEDREEVLVGPLFAFGALGQLAVDARRVGEMQALEVRFERDLRRFHRGRTP